MENTVCTICPIGYYCANGIINECQYPTPTTAAAGSSLQSHCVSCYTANSTTPAWDDSEGICTTCANADSSTPVQNGSSCEACPDGTEWDGNNCSASGETGECGEFPSVDITDVKTALPPEAVAIFDEMVPCLSRADTWGPLSLLDYCDPVSEQLINDLVARYDSIPNMEGSYFAMQLKDMIGYDDNKDEPIYDEDPFVNFTIPGSDELLISGYYHPNTMSYSFIVEVTFPEPNTIFEVVSDIETWTDENGDSWEKVVHSVTENDVTQKYTHYVRNYTVGDVKYQKVRRIGIDGDITKEHTETYVVSYPNDYTGTITTDETVVTEDGKKAYRQFVTEVSSGVMSETSVVTYKYYNKDDANPYQTCVIGND